MTITTLQLSQMFVGVVVNVYAYFSKLRGVDCDISYYHLNLGLIMYASYFLLFAEFFHRAYLKKRVVVVGVKEVDKKMDANSNILLEEDKHLKRGCVKVD
jgi:hypothetical protein